MELITENRYRMMEVLKEIEPRKIISFSAINLWQPECLFHLCDRQLSLIMNTKQFRNNPFDIPEKWEVRLNNKVHSKLAIGLKGFIIGSWNFSDNSSNNMHESILKVDYETAPLLQTELANYFEALWERSTPIHKEGMVAPII